MWRRWAAILLVTSVITGGVAAVSEARTAKFKMVGSTKVTGTAALGSTLTATPPRWSPNPTKTTVRWTRSGARIAGATGLSVEATLVGTYRATVTASRKKYATKSSTSNAVYVPQREVLSLGGSSSCGWHADGQVECWGENTHGQLGDGTTRSRATAGFVIGIPDPVVKVDVGSWHACALTKPGEVWCWGRDYVGALGNGTPVDSELYFWDAPVRTPGKVVGLTDKAVDLAVDWDGACALLQGGKGLIAIGGVGGV